jgi:hypothetical protein
MIELARPRRNRQTIFVQDFSSTSKLPQTSCEQRRLNRNRRLQAAEEKAVANARQMNAAR